MAEYRTLKDRQKELTAQRQELREKLGSRACKTDATYLQLKREQEAINSKLDAIKDVGAFVGGKIRPALTNDGQECGGSRQSVNVLGRDLITLDADSIPEDKLESVIINVKMLCAASCIYSTISHREESPRLRVLIPLDRTVNPGEHAAISKKLAELIGNEYIDKTTHDLNRLMYWPSCCSDAVPVFVHQDGPLISADYILSLCTEQERTASADTSKKLLPDPSTKPGWCGAFCAVYDIYGAIAEFLSDVYEPTAVEYRFDYLDSKSGSSPGALVYDGGTYLYSNHDTDPASKGQVGKLPGRCNEYNAYDLVRVHKFGHLDKDAALDTPFDKVPSQTAMFEFAKQIPAVVAAYKNEQALQEFSVVDITAYADDWGEPVPFDTEELPPFPLNSLPDWVRDYVEAVSIATQTPADMGAVAALGALTVPCNRVFEVRGSASWTENPNLYCLIVAEPASRKSAVLQSMIKPIQTYEHETNDLMRVMIARNRAEKEMLERQIANLKNKMAKTEGDNVDLAAEVLRKTDELTNFEDKQPIQLFCNDVTQEHLPTLMLQNHERMAVISDEGGIFEKMAGLYSGNNPNFDLFLQSHNGSPVKVQRVGREKVELKMPTLSMVLSVQPIVLHNVISNKAFKGRGLLARFMYCLPPRTAGYRDVVKGLTYTMPELAVYTYHTAFKRMLTAEVPDTPNTLTLSQEAFKASIEFAQRTEIKLRPDGALDLIEDWAGKLHGHILRIAGVLHAAEHAVNVKYEPWEEEIQVSTFLKAVAIGEYFTEHTKKAIASGLCEVEGDIAKKVLAWMVNKGARQYALRDISRGISKKYRKRETLTPILQQLCEMGHIKQLGNFYTLHPKYYRKTGV